MRSVSTAVFFAFCLSVGLYVNNRSWNGLVFVYVGEQRAPAAVRSITEYQAIDHKALFRTVQSQLMAFADVQKHDGVLAVQLGHPILTGKNGGREFGCEVQDHTGVYNRVQLVFMGTGVSESGEAPTMTVDARCRSERDLNRLEPIFIPMNLVLQNAPKNQKLNYGGTDGVQISFDAMPGSWPENWVLWTVRFYRADAPEESMTVDAQQLKQGRAQLLSFDWKLENREERPAIR
jgi:hypothetical protein